MCKRYEWIPTATTAADENGPTAAAAAPFVANAGRVFDLKHLPKWPQASVCGDEAKEAPSDATTPRRRWVTPRVLVGALPHSASEWCELLRSGITTVLDVSMLGPVGMRREGYMSALIDALAAVGTSGAPAGVEVLHMPLPRVPGTAPWMDEVGRSRAVTTHPARTVKDCLRVLRQRLVGATKVRCPTVPPRHSVAFTASNGSPGVVTTGVCGLWHTWCAMQCVVWLCNRACTCYRVSSRVSLAVVPQAWCVLSGTSSHLRPAAEPPSASCPFSICCRFPRSTWNVCAE